ncbi:MAG TPA: TIM barrel protein, partial [Chondromyces sp.]|nr:TIM barrel protein [Chondromyces sp.]
NIKEDFDGVLEEFDKVVGIERLKVLHINDSKNERGSKKDRHENIGFGYIGFEALNYIVHHPQLTEVPKILETPYVGEDRKNSKPPYKFEIEMFRNQTFDEEVLKKISNQ